MVLIGSVPASLVVSYSYFMGDVFRFPSHSKTSTFWVSLEYAASPPAPARTPVPPRARAFPLRLVDKREA